MAAEPPGAVSVPSPSSHGSGCQGLKADRSGARTPTHLANTHSAGPSGTPPDACPTDKAPSQDQHRVSGRGAASEGGHR